MEKTCPLDLTPTLTTAVTMLSNVLVVAVTKNRGMVPSGALRQLRSWR